MIKVRPTRPLLRFDNHACIDVSAEALKSNPVFEVPNNHFWMQLVMSGDLELVSEKAAVVMDKPKEAPVAPVLPQVKHRRKRNA